MLVICKVKYLLLFFFSLFSVASQHTINTLSDTSRVATSSSTNVYGPQYPDVFRENRAASALSDTAKVSLLEGKWDNEDLFRYKFPSRYLCYNNSFSGGTQVISKGKKEGLLGGVK